MWKGDFEVESGIFLLNDDNSLTKMVSQAYASEAILQRHLVTHPDLLAGDQINPGDPRRWLLIQREMGVPAQKEASDWWSLDHLFLDQDAVPTFVEVKRATDTRARREVVAQMLDYAANATEYWPVDRMREEFARRCTSAHLDPARELATLIGGESDEEAFWQLAKTNLADGRIRLLFVGDTIPPSLRRIVEFLNRHLSPTEVLAVEIRQFAAAEADGPRTLVPRVIGQTEQARAAKGGVRTSTTWEPIGSDEFIRRIAEDLRPTAQMILSTAEATGFAVKSWVRGDERSVRVWIAPPEVPGSPITLDGEFLWVSLGRYHQALREAEINRSIRAAILQVDPNRRQADDLKKTEIGIPLDVLRKESEEKLRALFVLIRSGLEHPTEASGIASDAN